MTDSLESFFQEASREQLVDEIRRNANLLGAYALVGSSLDSHQVLRSVLDQARLFTEAASASIFLINREEQCLEFAATTDGDAGSLKHIKVPMGQGISGHVAKTGETVNITNAQDDPRFYSNVDKQTGEKTTSYLCIPLLTGGEIIGTTQLLNKKGGGKFSDSDVRLMRNFAGLAGIAIERAILHEKAMEKERLEKEFLRMRTELDVARRIQKLVLPLEEELKRISGLEVAARMDTASEVGGDFYEALPGEKGETYFAIGDVTDHGLASGLVMLMVQAAFRTMVHGEKPDLESILRELNRLIFQNVQTRMKDGRNMTLAVLRHKNGQVDLSGYHESVILYRKEQDRFEVIDTTDYGMFLGLIDDLHGYIHRTSFELGEGDLMFLYTDGSVEAENKDRELFGQENLLSALKKRTDMPVGQIVDGVMDDIYSWIGDAVVYDDITLVCARRTAEITAGAGTLQVRKKSSEKKKR